MTAPRMSALRSRILPAVTAAIFWGLLLLPIPAAADSAKAHADFAGSTACRSCHEAEFSAWSGSHHDLAMQEATEATVLGDFSGSTLEADGVTSTFSRRDGRFFVRTEGKDGQPADFEIQYTFGIRPLQQYLVAFPGGRLQALRQAWDSRPKAEGGQRWFHLYPGETIAHDDQLHWTGIYQNWNLQCASCHSTDLRKNYDPATRTYATSYAEIDVSCESCHGPGREHVAWATEAKPPYETGDAKGLTGRLGQGERGWRFVADDSPIASLDPVSASSAASATTAMNVCAPCHARRSTLTEGGPPDQDLADSHRLAMLTDPLYYADGQQHDEVYTWGSFLQSKMHARGVVCTDCHDAHTARLKEQGNALCATCHRSTVFEAASHHFHEPSGPGAQCVNCHMPSRDYMVIDGRRDHSFRVPRPDLASALSNPDACSTCHAGRTSEWAAEAMDSWYGSRWRNRTEYGSVLAAVSTKGAVAIPSLMELATEPSWPPIVRATAATLAAPLLRPELAPAIGSKLDRLLVDPDPMVRLAALGLLEPLPATVRSRAAAPLLADPSRSVRTETARLLANIPDEQLTTEQRKARSLARQEFLDALALESDWPASLVGQGNFALREGRMDDAAAKFERAVEVDPDFAAAYVNLADARRLQGQEKEAEDVLRRGLAQLPKEAGLHHALGLLLVRRGDREAGVVELGRATELDPSNGRYAFVYAVGLESRARKKEALSVLVVADQHQPYDLDILGTLVSMNVDAEYTDAALTYARKLAELLPGDPQVRGLIERLEKKR